MHPLSVHHDAVRGTQIDDVDLQALTCRIHPDLGVPARNARVVDPQVSLAATADDQSRRLQRMPRAVDLEDQRRPADGGLTRPATALGNASDSLGGDGEATGRQVGVQLESRS